MPPVRPPLPTEPPIGLARTGRQAKMEEEVPLLTEEGLGSISASYFMKPVVSVDEEDSIREAAKLMAEKNIGSVVVARSGAYVGIVTERDIIVRAVATGMDEERFKVKDIMSAPLVTLDERATIAEATKLMVKKKIRRLPLTRGTRVVGIVTQTDLQKAILEVLNIITAP